MYMHNIYIMYIHIYTIYSSIFVRIFGEFMNLKDGETKHVLVLVNVNGIDIRIGELMPYTWGYF